LSLGNGGDYGDFAAIQWNGKVIGKRAPSQLKAVEIRRAKKIGFAHKNST